MHFEKRVHIAATPEAVFAFHESPGAFEKLSPPWDKAKVIDGGGSLHVGTRVVIRMGLGPIPLKWVAEHTEYDPPRLFADRQVSGPFAFWYHRHHFESDGQGGTWMRDEVDFEPPLGALGRWLAGGFLRKKLEKTFEYRHETTRRILESTTSVAP